MHFSLRLFNVVSAALQVNILHPHEVFGLRSNLRDHLENGGRLCRGRGGGGLSYKGTKSTVFDENESPSAVLSCGNVSRAVQGDSNF